MKNLLLAAAVLFVFVLCPSRAWSRQQQPIKYFGYAGAETATDLNRVSPYTNFSYIAASYDTSMAPQLTALKGKGMRAVIDLGRVLWCPADANNPLFTTWHLCTTADAPGGKDYVTRWNTWVNTNYQYLNSTYVLAFSVITEHTQRGIPVTDVQTATSLVKQTYYSIPTMLTDNADDIYNAGMNYQVPNNVDWISTTKYYIEPEFDAKFKQSVNIVKAKKQSWQKMAYVLDGIYGTAHKGIAPTVHDMDAIAQQWYYVASRDPEAILLGVFIWPNIPEEQLTGSANMGTTVLNKHTAIGKAILGGKYPTYQGKHEVADCMRIEGWAWDTSQPNTPISVDIYVDGVRRSTVRANTYRAGVGNGYHGFSSSLPAGLQDGQTHTITVKYNGTATLLPNSSQTIRCSNPTTSVAWVIPSEFSWGPPDTMTVAGYAQGGFGGVKMFWLDASASGTWKEVAWQPTPSADGTWSNTIPSSNRCHDYWVYVKYAGVTSDMFPYKGLESGYCKETVSIIWVQPQTTAGFGPPGSLIVAGSAKNAPSGYRVDVWYRNVTTGGNWTKHPYAPSPDSNGIWLMDIPVNYNYHHVYEIQAFYDVVYSPWCTYPGNNSIKWCQ
ncbi:MAG TPA: hypothetical protein VF297_17755 [Pyrinomonadaceae bacterium]